MLAIPGRIDVAGDLSLLYVDMNNTAIKRQRDALVIANISGPIKRINETKYVVKSQNGNGDCDVCYPDLGWVCSCPDHKFRGVKYKHVFAVEISFALRKEVEVAHIEPIDTQCCIYCKSSWIVRVGLRHNKYGAIQKFNCREWNRYFTIKVSQSSTGVEVEVAHGVMLNWRNENTARKILVRCLGGI